MRVREAEVEGGQLTAKESMYCARFCMSVCISIEV